MMSASEHAPTKKPRQPRSQADKADKGKGPRVDLDLDSKHVVSHTDLRVLSPTPHPTTTAPSASAFTGDSTVVCALSSRLSVCMKGVRVLKFAEGRRNVSSLTLRVSRNALNNLMDVDDALLTQARRETDDWFGPGNSVARVANVDEFFRASTATDRSAGIVAKFSLDVSRSSRAPAFSAVEGDDVDVVLQLVGIRFLRQHVDVLWRFVSSTASEGPFAHEVRSLPVSEDEADEAILGPTPEEREAMFTELFARIEAERSLTDTRLRELDSLADSLEDGRDACDAHILETVSERLDGIMAAGLSCRQDTSYCS